MVKRFLKGAVCAALAVSMALGTVIVGASEKSVIAINTPFTTEEQHNDVSIPLKKVDENKTKSVRESQPVIARNIWNVSDWYSFMNNKQPQDGVLGSSTSAGNIIAGRVKVNYSGTAIIKYYCKVNNSDTLLTLVNLDGSNIANAEVFQKGIGNGRQLWVSNVPAGTYAMVTSKPYDANSTINAGFLTSVVPKNNNRYLNSLGIAVGGNGAFNYEYFKLSNRGVAALGMYRKAYYGGPYSVQYVIQKYSNGAWRNITSPKYTSSNKSYMTYAGLSAGTYRLQTKCPTGNVVFLHYAGKKANSSYGTKKSKARTTYIDITSLGQEGTIYCQISGRTRFKTKNIKNGKRFYAKAKKGTYYIKMYKYSKSTTGGYKIKYTK
ncbi:hypothetical protein [Anaerostipes faecalis]|uniref:hypothetical protein n=1 Tax=Anaerostipes faecalis TaxID=2738446 RepID=UPI001C1DDB6C|nr:hypothetical protein [Anaerostipes faecalis]